jgi:hypothetical protein
LKDFLKWFEKLALKIFVDLRRVRRDKAWTVRSLQKLDKSDRHALRRSY